MQCDRRMCGEVRERIGRVCGVGRLAAVRERTHLWRVASRPRGSTRRRPCRRRCTTPPLPALPPCGYRSMNVDAVQRIGLRPSHPAQARAEPTDLGRLSFNTADAILPQRDKAYVVQVNRLVLPKSTKDAHMLCCYRISNGTLASSSNDVLSEGAFCWKFYGSDLLL